jgi:2-polyprenyl-6-methoxyphenol hydroxylase-like FAD-dependent oxidoreductase
VSGPWAASDLLVGADGTGSRVRRQYLPQARQVRPGVGGVAHKVFLTDDVRRWIPERLSSGMNVISHGGVAVFTSAFDPPAGAGDVVDGLTGHRSTVDSGAGGRYSGDGLQPYLLCALVTDTRRLPEGFARLGSPELERLVDRLLDGWHPALRRMLAAADPGTRSAVEFTASLPTPPWPTSRVTVLGDAIHTMPATGGQGGNTALRDARHLTRQLVAVSDSRLPLLDAIATYEEGLRHRGDAAVRSTLEIKDRMLASGTARTMLGHTWFRLCRAVPALRRRTFRDWAAGNLAEPWEHEKSAESSTVVGRD